MRGEVFRLDDVVVDVAGRQIARGGVRIALEPKSLDVLVILLREAGRVVDKKQLLTAVWTDVHVTDSSLARGPSRRSDARSATTRRRRATSRRSPPGAIGSLAR